MAGIADGDKRTATHKRPRVFFLAIAVALATVVALGFSCTFFIPLFTGEFVAPAIFFVHGGLFFTWIALFVLQATWIRVRRVTWHRMTGWFAVGLVLPMAVSLVGVGVAVCRRDLALGQGDAAISQIVGTCTAAIMFVALVAAGVLYRRRPAVHRRLLLLATVGITWPAFQRLRHLIWVPQYEIWLGVVLANVPIVVAMLHDLRSTGRIHRVYWLGVLLIAEEALEVTLYDTQGWRVVARVLFNLFG